MSFGRVGFDIFAKAVEIAQDMEVAARDTQLFKNNSGVNNKFTHANRQ